MTNGPNVARVTRTGEVCADDQDPRSKKPSKTAEVIPIRGGFGRIQHRLTRHMERWPRYHVAVYQVLIQLCDNNTRTVTAAEVARRLERPVRTCQLTIADLEAWGFIRRRGKKKNRHMGSGFEFAGLDGFEWTAELDSFAYLDQRHPHNARNRRKKPRATPTLESPSRPAKAREKAPERQTSQSTPLPSQPLTQWCDPPERGALLSGCDHSSPDTDHRSPEGSHTAITRVIAHSDHPGDRSTDPRRNQQTHQEGPGGDEFESRIRTLCELWARDLRRHDTVDPPLPSDMRTAVERVTTVAEGLGLGLGKHTKRWAQRYLLQIKDDPDIWRNTFNPFRVALTERYIGRYFGTYRQQLVERSRERRRSEMGGRNRPSVDANTMQTTLELMRTGRLWQRGQ